MLIDFYQNWDYLLSTLAPQCFNNCMAQLPTPPDPPMTSTFLLVAFITYKPPNNFNADHAVMPVYSNPAASSLVKWSGFLAT